MEKKRILIVDDDPAILRLLSTNLKARGYDVVTSVNGEESLETDLFGRGQIPWGRLAFPTIPYALEHYFEDLDRGEFRTRIKDMIFRRRIEE